MSDIVAAPSRHPDSGGLMLFGRYSAGSNEGRLKPLKICTPPWLTLRPC